jgi:hypothetical protein
LEAKVEGRDSTGSVVPQDISRPAVNLFGLKEAMMFFKAPEGTLSIDRAAMRLYLNSDSARYVPRVLFRSDSGTPGADKKPAIHGCPWVEPF